VNSRRARQKRKDVKELSAVMLDRVPPAPRRVMYIIMALMVISVIASVFCVLFIRASWVYALITTSLVLVFSCIPVIHSIVIRALIVKRLEHKDLKDKNWRRVYRKSKRRKT